MVPSDQIIPSAKERHARNAGRFSMTRFGKKWQTAARPRLAASFLQRKDGRMARHDIADLAFERAWRVYRLMNPSVDEQDEKRALLDRFVKKCCDAGASDPELVVVEALKYLKRLEGFGESD